MYTPPLHEKYLSLRDLLCGVKVFRVRFGAAKSTHLYHWQPCLMMVGCINTVQMIVILISIKHPFQTFKDGSVVNKL